MKQNKDIFSEKFLPLYSKLYTIATAILGDVNGEAQDAVQDTMVKIWNSGKALTTIKNAEGYAVAVLRTTAIDILRKRHYVTDINQAAELSTDAPPDPDGTAFLERVIDMLPPNQQEVIRLSAYNNMSTDEIAATTGLTPGNTRQLLSRARKKIKDIYAKYMQS